MSVKKKCLTIDIHEIHQKILMEYILLAKDFPKPAMLTKDITGKSFVNNIYSWIRLQYMNERYSLKN